MSLLLANTTETEPDVPYNNDGGGLYNYDKFFEVEFIYLLIPSYALLIFAAALLTTAEPPVVNNMAQAPISLKIKCDIATVMMGILLVQFILIRALTIETLWQVAFPRWSNLYIFEILAWFTSFRLSIFEFRHGFEHKFIHRIFWILSLVFLIIKFFSYRFWLPTNLLLNCVKQPCTIILTIYAIWLPKDVKEEYELQMLLEKAPRFVVKFLVKVHNLRNFGEPTKIGQIDFSDPDVGKLNFDEMSDSRSEFVEALEDMMVDLENPPVIKITVNPQIYGIDQVRHLKIMISINDSAPKKVKRKQSEIWELGKALQEFYTYQDYPRQSDIQNLRDHRIDPDLNDPNSFIDKHKYFIKHLQNLLNALAADPIFWCGDFLNFIEFNVMNSLELQSYIAKQKGKHESSFKDDRISAGDYNTFKPNAPPTGAELMREMDMLMGNTDNKKKSEMTQDLGPPPKSTWEKSGLGAEMELFSSDPDALKFESQFGIGDPQSEREFEKIRDPFHDCSGQGLFHVKTAGKLPVSTKNLWHFFFKVSHKKTHWEISKTVPDFLEFLEEMKTKYRDHIEKVVQNADFRIKRIRELLKDVEKQQHGRFPDWNRTIERAKILDNTLGDYQRLTLSDDDWHCDRLLTFIEFNGEIGSSDSHGLV